MSREKCGNALSAYMERRPEREKAGIGVEFLKKTQESWNAYTPVSKELLKQTEDVLDAFLHEKREGIESRPIIS